MYTTIVNNIVMIRSQRLNFLLTHKTIVKFGAFLIFLNNSFY